MMKVLSVCLLTCVLAIGATPIWAETGIPQQDIVFKKGASSGSASGKIKGNNSIDYLVRAKAGQRMTVDFKAAKSAAYFNVLSPNGEALFVGSSEGYRYMGELPADGVYTIRPYLMGAAKSSNKDVSFTIKVNIAAEQNNISSGKPANFAAGSYVEITAKGQTKLLSGPSMIDSSAIGDVSEGRLMKVLECVPNDGLWCELEAHSDAKLRGWVQARHLKVK
jgi:hypothetical protein